MFRKSLVFLLGASMVLSLAGMRRLVRRRRRHIKRLCSGDEKVNGDEEGNKLLFLVRNGGAGI